MQLALNIDLHDEVSFNTFVVGDNPLIINELKNLIINPKEKFIYLWGDKACGKTHLLQATGNYAISEGKTALYLPLSDFASFGAAVFDNLVELDYIFLDDIDTISGRRETEQALFNLYNVIREQNKTCLVVSSSVPPGGLENMLPDLKSRLSWGLSLKIAELNDEQKLLVFANKAKARGIVLSQDVGQFLLNRYGRSMAEFLGAFDILAKATLIAKRRLTIPFVKEVLKI